MTFQNFFYLSVFPTNYVLYVQHQCPFYCLKGQSLLGLQVFNRFSKFTPSQQLIHSFTNHATCTSPPALQTLSICNKSVNTAITLTKITRLLPMTVNIHWILYTDIEKID